jgi:HAD superfamily hydrolase (TIGR01509 family)
MTSSTSPSLDLDWQLIDIVLLDMDGTLLDLRFDNYFWQELVPVRYARQHGISLEQAHERLIPRFEAKRGTLDWYCLDFWSRELALDIADLKREVREHVRFLPGAEAFLQSLRERRVRTALVTNAHHESLAVKEAQTNLAQYFDYMISSHEFGFPKEHRNFWQRLQAELRFDPKRALFVDDSLAVLRAARDYGIGQIIAVTHPDSTQDHRIIEEFPSVRGVRELISERA